MDPLQLVDIVAAQQASYAAARRLYADRLASDFNVFDFFEPDELFLSRIVAWLLDPRGSHGQGTRFLALFISRLHLQWDSEALRETVVQTEVQTDRIARAYRRIDILVTSGQKVIAIENKPWAGDQLDQISDYLLQLDRSEFSERTLVFLSGTARDPAASSIPEAEQERRKSAGELVLMTYSHLHEWLGDCRGQCYSGRVLTFIDDFRGYIESTFLGAKRMDERNAIAAEILRSPDRVAAAFEVSQAIGALKNSLLGEFREKLRISCVRHGLELDGWVMDGTPWSGFRVSFGDIEGYQFGLQFKKASYNGLQYGATLRDPSSTLEERRSDPVRPVLNRYLGEAPVGGGSWIWIRTGCPTDANLPIDTDWDENSSPWLAMRDGSLITAVMNCARKIQFALQQSLEKGGEVARR